MLGKKIRRVAFSVLFFCPPFFCQGVSHDEFQNGRRRIGCFDVCRRELAIRASARQPGSPQAAARFARSLLARGQLRRKVELGRLLYFDKRLVRSHGVLSVIAPHAYGDAARFRPASRAKKAAVAHRPSSIGRTVLRNSGMAEPRRSKSRRKGRSPIRSR